VISMPCIDLYAISKMLSVNSGCIVEFDRVPHEQKRGIRSVKRGRTMRF